MELYQLIINQAANALDEDVGSGDISAALIDADGRLDTELLVREDAVLCGCQWFDEVMRQCDAGIDVRWLAGDGDAISANSVVCEVSGPARGLLTAERSAINFLQTLSGTATTVRTYASASVIPAAASSIPAKPFPNCASHRSMPCSAVAAATIVLVFLMPT